MFAELHMHIFMNGFDYNKAVGDNKNTPDINHIHEVFKAYKDKNITFIRDGGDNLGVSETARNIAGEYGIRYISPIFAIHKKGLYGSIVGKSWQDLSDIKSLIGEVKAKQGDFIKIMTTGILDFATYGSISEGALTFDEIKTIADIAHDKGFKVMSHTNGAENIINASNAGVDSIEHGYYMNDEAIEVLRKNKTVWVPTVATSVNLLDDGKYPIETVRRIADKHLSNISRAINSGVNVGLGSDAGAYCVPHALGTVDEYNAISNICDDIIKLNATLKTSEDIIKSW